MSDVWECYMAVFKVGINDKVILSLTFIKLECYHKTLIFKILLFIQH